MALPFDTDFYHIVSKSWPSSGKVILGTFTSESIVLYQAYNLAIAQWAVTHKTFAGCPLYKPERMTWVKPNFLWMMFRSGWATKPNQERILAITIKRSGFEEILSNASTKPRVNEDTVSSSDDVRLQWDPDHDPYGDKVERRAIQLGLRGGILKKFLHEWILDITDITDFVSEQYKFVQKKDLNSLMIPKEKVFIVEDDALRKCLEGEL